MTTEDEPTESAAPTDPWKRWIGWVRKWRHYIIFFWLCIVFPIGYSSKQKFIDATDTTFHPVPGTDSADAQDIYDDAYVVGDNQNDPIIILLQQTENVDNETMVDGTSELYNATKSFVASYKSYLISKADDPNDVVVEDYYALDGVGLHDLAISSFYSTTYQAMMITVTTYFSHDTLVDYVDDVKDYGDKHVPQQLSICYTGTAYFQKDMNEDAAENMEVMDAVSLPLAVFILCLVLKGNLLLMIIPIIMIFTSIMASSLVMYPIASSLMQVTQFTPSIMMSLSIALGIDYSLFILSRATDELPSASDPDVKEKSDHAVSVGLEFAGHSILVSGSTVMICLLGLAFLPLQIIVSMGIGSGIAVFFVLLVNLTLVPSLLYTRFGRTLMHLNWQRIKGVIKNKCCKKEESDVGDEPADQQLTEPLLDEQPTSEAATKEDEIVSQTRGWWFRLGTYLLRWPSSAIILAVMILAIITPAAVFFPELDPSISLQLMLPDDNPSMECYDSLGDFFGAGAVAPYRIIFVGSKNNQRVDTSEGFDVMHRVVSQLSGNSSALSIDTLDSSSVHASFSGISTLNGELIPYSTYEMAIECGTNCTDESLRTIAYLDLSLTTENRETTYITATLDENPFSVPGTDWLDDARDTLNALKSNGDLKGYKVVIQGGTANEYDAMNKTYEAFPMMIIVTALIVLILIGAFFKSIITPIRSVVSIALTQMFCFGLAVLVYQRGILDWMGIDSLSSYSTDSSSSASGEIHFIPPIMAFSIIVGLSIDYDVFLITRVLEHRMDRFDDKSSILLGLQGTGGIITAAGVIMAVAFGGLLASSSLLLNQFAFLLCTAVLLDTFVIRTVVVPILFGYTGKYCWWPRSLPPVEKSAFSDANESNEDETLTHENVNESETSASQEEIS